MALNRVKNRTLMALALATAAVGAAVGVSPAAAQDIASSGIKGVWLISQPTTEVRPVSGAIPFTSEGRQRYRENREMRARGVIDDYDITATRCANPGVPRLALTPMRFKIWEQAGVITFDYEWNRAIRQIDTRGVERELPLVPNITGLSSARWEGQTLVARTVDVAERTLIDDLVPHSSDMVVTETYRLIDPETLENRVRIEDPVMFSRPWEYVVTYRRQPDTIFPEDVCLDRLDAGGTAFPQR